MKILPFSRFLTEESTGYAKLKSKRYRKIRYNEQEKAIMTDEEAAAISGVALYLENNPDDEDAYANKFEEIKTQRNVNLEEFEVFYSFSSSIRGNRRYGNENWSARFLYEFICAAYNSGERFIDIYLNRVFTSRPVYRVLVNLVKEVEENIEERWNDGNLKGGQWTSFYRFQASEMSGLLSSLERFSREVRQDIIVCLSTGMIPLNFSLSQNTIKKRLSLGLSGDTPFYATSWLINELEVHVILGASETGKLFYSDSYKGAL